MACVPGPNPASKLDMPGIDKGRPIFDRVRLVPMKQPITSQKDSLEIEAEQIRKAWMERTHSVPAK
jgi:hypothetical protein